MMGGDPGGNDPPPPPGFGYQQCPERRPQGGQRWRNGFPDDDGGGGGDDDGDDYMGEGGHDARTVWRKESTKIELSPLPAVSNFRPWRLEVLRTIAAASSTPRRAFLWIAEVDDSSISKSRLSQPGAFESLDGKLIIALNRIIAGELQRKVNTLIEEDMKRGVYASGRSMLRIVFEQYETDVSKGALYSVSDLMQVRVANGTPEALASFASQWAWIETGLTSDVNDSVKESLFYEQIKSHAALQPELWQYRLAERGSAVKSYQYLRDVVERHIRRSRQETNREQVIKGFKLQQEARLRRSHLCQVMKMIRSKLQRPALTLVCAGHGSEESARGETNVGSHIQKRRERALGKEERGGRQSCQGVLLQEGPAVPDACSSLSMGDAAMVSSASLSMKSL